MHVNVSLQALSLHGAPAFVAATLAAAVARDTDVAVIAELATAAGTAVADVDAAMAALAPWPGPRIVATGSVEGAADLLAAADTSAGALSVLFDPNMGAMRLAIAPAGVSLDVRGGVQQLAAVSARVLGQEAAAFTNVYGPVVGAGAVARW